MPDKHSVVAAIRTAFISALAVFERLAIAGVTSLIASTPENATAVYTTLVLALISIRGTLLDALLERAIIGYLRGGIRTGGEMNAQQERGNS